MDNLRDRRELYNGFGTALSRAFELVVTPLLFGLGGHLLDGALGTGPVFTVVLVLLCLVGMFLRSWYAYDAEMKAHERVAPWSRGKQGV
ncbi:MAG TPA: AtpZ/AtpI family protein [Acidimicrobiales bacterium]|nr:AtpZ/AtpI family protein [Acidimicrobiales bacterium]